MALTSFALGLLLLGQISQRPTAAGDSPPAARDRTAPKQSPAGELLAEALPLPEQQALAGRELTLVKALAGTSDRRHRHEITRAYWKLSMAVSACQLTADQNVLLGGIGPPKDSAQPQLSREDQKTLAATRDAARAQWAEAELHAIETQHVLADLLGWPLGESLPLPADRPHIGTYQTKFDLLFANRQPPVRTRMIDRTLPIRREAIEARATAVQAARDAWQIAVEGYEAGQTTLDSVLQAAAGVDRQRRFFLAAVEQYNLDIAEYVSTVAREGTNETEFVAMLIRPRSPAPAPKAQAGWQPGFSTPRERATPATYDAPLDNDTRADAPLLRTSPPSLIAPTEPGIEDPESGIRNQEESGITDPQSAIRNPQSRHFSFRQPFSDGRQYNPSATQPPRASSPDRPLAMYAGLQKLDRPEQQRQLAASLHWDNVPPEPDRLPMTLDEFLHGVPVASRVAALAAYWQAREQSAWVQVLSQRRDRIEEMVAPVLALRERPEAADAMLRLQAVRSAAKADLLDARAALFASQAELMFWSPKPSADTWWWPETQPQAGGYPAEFPGVKQWEGSSRLHQRLALRLPALEGALADQAAAVINADAARAIHAQHFAADHLALDGLLAAMDAQTAQTEAFLRGLTQFNLAVGSYALAVLPARASSEALSLALVRGPAAAM